MLNMNKTVISKLIISKSDRVKLVTYDAGKSDVWASFVKVHVDDKFKDFVKCKSCSTLLKWKPKDGTSGLKAHTRACLAQHSNTAITRLSGFIKCATTTRESRQLTPTDQAAVTECMARCCARNIRLFNVVEGEGFKKVAQQLINLGAKYGHIQVTDILPSGRTLSRHVDIVSKERDALKSTLNDIDRFGVTTDMWTHEDASTPYITVTIIILPR